MDVEQWLRESLPALVRYANVLCGRSLAEEIVQDVAIKAHARWVKIAVLDHPEAYVGR